jgi:hypothetical protein
MTSPGFSRLAEVADLPGATNRFPRLIAAAMGSALAGASEFLSAQPIAGDARRAPRTVTQLRTFLQRARSDRFFALSVLEATSGVRRCELAGARRDLLDLDAGTLAIEMTRVVVDGRVIESDGKTENAQHMMALDPFTLAVLRTHCEMLDAERAEFGPDYDDQGLLFCWEDGRPPHPDTITRRFHKLSAAEPAPGTSLPRHEHEPVSKSVSVGMQKAPPVPGRGSEGLQRPHRPPSAHGGRPDPVRCPRSCEQYLACLSVYCRHRAQQRRRQR